MITNKKNILITLLIVLFAGVFCTLIFSNNILQASQSEDENIYGTYQLNINNLNNAEYIAIMPSISDENTGQFQWYNIDDEVLKQGNCKINNGFITLYTNNQNAATIFYTNNNYYFVDNASEAIEITKISREPIVCQPID